MNRFYATVAATVLAFSAFDIPAHAADREVDIVSVDYSDLNLSTTAGVNTLRRRLIVASRDVCGHGDMRLLGAGADTQACREAALKDALRDLRRVVASAQTQRDAELASLAQK